MKNALKLIKRFIPAIFWLGFFATLFFTMIPNQSIPTSIKFWDKAQHAIAFFMLIVTGGIAYSKEIKSIFIGLILYGASIEIMQEFFTRTRNGDVYDILADTVGVILGWLLFLMIYRFSHQKS